MFTVHFAIIVLSIALALSAISSIIDNRRVGKLEKRVQELEERMRFRGNTTLL